MGEIPHTSQKEGDLVRGISGMTREGALIQKVNRTSLI